MKLSDRVMALEGPDWEIFLAAYTACYPNGGTPWASDACHQARFELLVDKEAWLSAAEMLVPEGMWHEIKGRAVTSISQPQARIIGAPDLKRGMQVRKAWDGEQPPHSLSAQPP